MSSRRPETSPISAALAEAWRRDASSGDRVARAYRRFLLRRAPRPRSYWREVAVSMLAGMLLGMGSLFAATGGRFFVSWNEPASGPAQRPSGTASTAGALGARVGRSSSSAEAPARAAEEVAAPALATPPPTRRPESWQRAARGLREGDFVTADDALLKLSQQGSEAEREAATLVRAQVLLKQGRDVEARALLERLSRTGASAVNRDKATSLLAQFARAPTSHRSFELEPSTNPP